jgi:TPR repeat protein
VQQRDEGVLIDKSRTVTDIVSVPTGRNEGFGPTYQKESRSRTISEQILLRNTPEGVSLPVFAIPIGNSISGNITVRTFDYGTPVSAQEISKLRTKAAEAKAQAKSPITNSNSSSSDKLLKYDTEAAEKGHASSQFRMGKRYLSGDGVTKDEEKGKLYLRKAAAQGYEAAVEELSNLKN